jgi:diaminohydroxyphosphoribosylaminopyrimidine deaminase / 5-amino-6-(5-phosphoribosylamino)uracil reductase
MRGSSSEREVHRYWMLKAISLSRQCPPSRRAYSVGAIIVDAEGNEVASGFSRDIHASVHAEESALGRSGRLPRGAVLYSTMEPCSERRSGTQTCSELILAAGIEHVVIAWREPSTLVDDCIGVELLTSGGVRVTELHELGDEASRINSHLMSTLQEGGGSWASHARC